MLNLLYRVDIICYLRSR